MASGSIDRKRPSSPQVTPVDDANIFVRGARKIYHAIGFRKGYNFFLWFILAGAFAGFCAARAQYLNIEGVFFENILISEKYWYSSVNLYRIGITIHLASVIPAGMLVIFQFVPIIRYKALFLHRLNGYIIICLILTGNAGALIISRRAFGGTIEVQAGVVTMAFLTTTSIFLAYYNIKKLQIEQHRKWMIRAWAYLGVILTMRFIMLAAAVIVNASEAYWLTAECTEVEYFYTNSNTTLAAKMEFQGRYPTCVDSNGRVNNGSVAIQGKNGRTEEITVGYKMGFGMALWVTMVLHAVLAEVYLALTNRETERLRMVSYEKQRARGWKNPGREGLTADRVGDAVTWEPKQA